MEASLQRNRFEPVYYKSRRAARMWKRNGIYYEKDSRTKKKERRDFVTSDKEAFEHSVKKAPKASGPIPRDRKISDFWNEVFLTSSKFVKAAERTQDAHRERFRSHIEPVIGERTIKNVGTQDVIKVLHTMRDSTYVDRITKQERSYGPQSLYNLQTTLSALFTVAKDHQYRTDHPVVDLPKSERIEQPKAKKIIGYDLVYRPEELRALVEHASERRYQEMFFLAPRVGGRISEVCGLRLSSIDWERGAIVFDKQLAQGSCSRLVPLKWEREEGAKARVVYPGNEAMRRLRQYVNDMEAERDVKLFPSTWLFPSPQGNATSAQAANAALVDAHKAAGIPLKGTSRFHVFRHTAASYLADEGWSLHEIADFLGDDYLQVKERYGHRINEDRRAARMNATWEAAYGG